MTPEPGATPAEDLSLAGALRSLEKARARIAELELAIDDVQPLIANALGQLERRRRGERARQSADRDTNTQT